MAHHAYLLEGERDVTVPHIEKYLVEVCGFSSHLDPDIAWFDYPQISVEDARRVGERAYRSAQGRNGTVLVLVSSRIFHQAQNALLKIFEEPPQGVTFILSVPQVGQLLPTLQSRLLSLPLTSEAHAIASAGTAATAFLALDSAGREKYIATMLDRVKVDDDDAKQRARAEVAAFLADLVRSLNRDRARYSPKEWEVFMKDCHTFLPIVHERSAPLKPILEHLRLTIPSLK